MELSTVYIPESAMAIFAHPDDIEFSCAGTLARWAQHGCRISYIICTSGDVGITDPNVSKEEAAKIREEEQREAAKIVGAQEVIFLRYPDGLLQPTLELRKELVRHIRRFRPEVIITGDPTQLLIGDSYINHPDHRAAAIAALDAAFPAAGQPKLFEELQDEGLSAHKPRKIFVVSRQQGNYFVRIDETINIKVNALRTHKSQLNDWDPEQRIKTWAQEIAKGKEMAYAESFRVITLVSDEDWQKTKGHVQQ